MIQALAFLFFAVCQLVFGAKSGGWSTELGLTHYCFGLYILGDAIRYGLAAFGGRR